MPGEEATAVLVALAQDAREAPVVRYTAGVSLVHQGTVASLAAGVRVARAATLPHLRREIAKAFSRFAHAPRGSALLRQTFGQNGVPDLG